MIDEKEGAKKVFLSENLFLVYLDGVAPCSVPLLKGFCEFKEKQDGTQRLQYFQSGTKRILDPKIYPL